MARLSRLNETIPRDAPGAAGRSLAAAFRMAREEPGLFGQFCRAAGILEQQAAGMHRVDRRAGRR